MSPSMRHVVSPRVLCIALRVRGEAAYQPETLDSGDQKGISGPSFARR